ERLAGGDDDRETGRDAQVTPRADGVPRGEHVSQVGGVDADGAQSEVALEVAVEDRDVAEADVLAEVLEPSALDIEAGPVDEGVADEVAAAEEVRGEHDPREAESAVGGDEPAGDSDSDRRGAVAGGEGGRRGGQRAVDGDLRQVIALAEEGDLVAVAERE